MEFSKCIRCKLIPCIDLFKSWGELEGAELFILDQLDQIIRKKSFFPCVVGAPIYVLCRFASVLASDERNIPFTIVLYQVVRDLKCSVFLGLCGRYRNSIQILRPVIENFLAGIYFMVIKDVKAFEQWIKGEYYIPDSLWEEIKGRKPKKSEKLKLDYSFCLEYITQKAVRPSFKKWWGERKNLIEKKLISTLNKYLHPHFPSFEIANAKKCAGCPAAVKYNEEEFKKWLEIFQTILFFMLEVLLMQFGDLIISNKESREALWLLLESPEVKEKLLLYPEYKKFVEWLEDQFKEYYGEKS